MKFAIGKISVIEVACIWFYACAQDIHFDSVLQFSFIPFLILQDIAKVLLPLSIPLHIYSAFLCAVIAVCIDICQRLYVLYGSISSDEG